MGFPKKNKKCSFENESGEYAMSFGGYEIDPCEYEEIEVIENCTVHILRCRKCGHIEIEWERQEDEE